VIPDFDHCYSAVQSRDARFDGWFFTAVTSTGIYCRPSCPAITPRRANVRFYPSAAAAQQAGFRACKRCRPDAAPGSPEWNGRADVVARAVRLIADGVVDRDGVPGLAWRLGYSTRQLERLLLAELGAPPLALARAQRAQTARILVETTSLPLSHVALAAGFASIRQFNDTIKSVFALTPTQLRRKAAHLRPAGRETTQTVRLRLPFRRPMEPAGLLSHLGSSSVRRMEEANGSTYRRTLSLPGGPGVLSLTFLQDADFVSAILTLADLRDLTAAIARARRLLDLDSDPGAVDDHLRRDAVLSPLVSKNPGTRIPGSIDAGEMALRVVLGQGVSRAAARTHAGRLAATLGETVDDPDGSLSRTFPTADRLAGAPDSALALPAIRRDAFRTLATALASGKVVLGPGVDWWESRRLLGEIPGLGRWSVEMIAMRALGDPDALPVEDLGVKRGAAMLGLPAQPRALSERAEGWRPWRSYAVARLWRLTDNIPEGSAA
jgi:AraC family transcriptional regulator of adaptative response / DNA-3-methyladenine glycosylase II